MIQMILLCGTGEAVPSTAEYTVGTGPLWADSGTRHSRLGLTHLGPGCFASSPSSKCHEGSRNLCANDVAPSQDLSLWISATHFLAALASCISGSAFSQVQPRVGQDGCPT